ncbi:MAG: hypothetical protein WC683_03750 [bacterium]
MTGAGQVRVSEDLKDCPQSIDDGLDFECVDPEAGTDAAVHVEQHVDTVEGEYPHACLAARLLSTIAPGGNTLLTAVPSIACNVTAASGDDDGGIFSSVGSAVDAIVDGVETFISVLDNRKASIIPMLGMIAGGVVGGQFSADETTSVGFDLSDPNNRARLAVEIVSERLGHLVDPKIKSEIESYANYRAEKITDMYELVNETEWKARDYIARGQATETTAVRVVEDLIPRELWEGRSIGTGVEVINAFLRGDLGREPTAAEVTRVRDAIRPRSYFENSDLKESVMGLEGKRIFQIFTSEFMDGLAAELRKMSARFEDTHGRKPVIREIGAGDGRLSAGLRSRGIDIEATDNGSWELGETHLVTRMDSVDAARQSDIVLGSWLSPPDGRHDADVARVIAENPEKALVVVGQPASNCGSFTEATYDNATNSKRFYDFISDPSSGLKVKNLEHLSSWRTEGTTVTFSHMDFGSSNMTETGVQVYRGTGVDLDAERGVFARSIADAEYRGPERETMAALIQDYLDLNYDQIKEEWLGSEAAREAFGTFRRFVINRVRPYEIEDADIIEESRSSRPASLGDGVGRGVATGVDSTRATGNTYASGDQVTEGGREETVQREKDGSRKPTDAERMKAEAAKAGRVVEESRKK